MNTSEIKELTSKEIVERIDAEVEAMVRMRMNHAVSPLDNPQKIRETRRNIARLKTVLRQRKNNDQK